MFSALLIKSKHLFFVTLIIHAFLCSSFTKKIFQKGEIIEQLGRMYAQDGYGEDTIIYAATLAARFYHNGNTVKEIAAYLRRVRKAKSWDV